MNVAIFGKKDCARCKAAKNRISHAVRKLALEGKVRLSFLDMDTAEGLAEGMLNDVERIPTTIIRCREKELARWDGKAPLTAEFKRLIDDIYE